MKNIVLFKSAWDNVGDGFVQIGAEFILNTIFDNAKVISISEMGGQKYYYHKAFADTGQFPSLLDVLGEKIDMVVLAGCVLKPETLTRLYKKIRQLKISPKIALIGAGGHSYDEKVVASTKKALQLLQPDYLISRDSSTFEIYKDCFRTAMQGIDCAFFVSDVVKPLNFKKDIVIKTFDYEKDMSPPRDRTFYVTHYRYRLKSEHPFRSIGLGIRNTLRKQSLFPSVEIFQSDRLDEYLHLYSIASEVHTDLVHATIVSMAYGTAVQNYRNSPRNEVITSLFGDAVFSRLTKIDVNSLEDVKNTKMDEMACMLRS